MADNYEDIQRAIGQLEGKMDSVLKVVNDLKVSFDVLERGRLSRLEVNFATLNAEVGIKAKNTALWTGAIVSGIISLISSFILIMLKF